MGSLTNLMKNEKIVVAIVRIRDQGSQEQTIPIAFKIKKDVIPPNIKFGKTHSNNMFNLTLAGAKPLPVMIVCLGGEFYLLNFPAFF